jgi:hypothetical protein
MVPMLQHVDPPGSTGALQVSLKALIDLLVLIALMVAAALPLLLLIVAADWLFRHGKLTAIDASAGAWGEVILSLGAMALPLAWIARRWRSLEIPAGTTPAAGVVFGLVAGLLAAGISYPTGWLGQWTGNDILPSNTAYVDQLLQGPWLLSLLVLVVMAPVSEEIVFRKFLLARFLKSGHPLLGIALTSVLFGLMHEPFPSGEQSIAGWALLLADYSLAGTLFAAAYCLTGRLSAAILAHATNNLIVCLAYWWSF